MHKQLPFLGKKTKPAEIRPDLWIPYARVDFTSDETWKGLLAYRKLIEYQKLRYYAWRKKGQAGIHKTRPELLEKIQDQSRTSVADLANVLWQSQRWEKQKMQRREAEIQREEEKYQNVWTRTLHMARQGKEGKLAEATDRVNKATNSKERIQARTELNRYKRAGEAVAAVESGEIDQALQERWNEELRKMVDYKLTGKIEGYEMEADALPTATTGEADASSPTATTGEAEDQSPSTEDTTSSKQPTTARISIRWADLRDAEWARTWPVPVTHDQIGYTSREAPFGSRLGAPVTDALNRRKAEQVGKKSDWEVFHKIASGPIEATV